MFKTVADKTAQGVIIIQGDQIRYVNAAIAKIIGYSLREVRSWQPTDLLSRILQHQRKEMTALFQRALQGRVKTRAYEVCISDKRGRVRWVKSFPKLIKIEGESAILVTVTDVTDYKEAAQELKASEERYRSFLEHFQGIAYSAVIAGVPVFFHGAVKAITGYSEKDFVSGRVLWQDLIHPEDWVLIERDWGRLGSIPGSRVEREYRIIRKDKRVRWLLEHCHNVSDESGQVFGVDGHIYDITERKAAEDARHESETRYRTLVEISPDAIFLTDLGGRILLLNPQSVALFGFTSAAKILGRNALDFVQPQDHHRTIEKMRQAIAEGRATNIEYTIIRQNGESRFVDASVSVITGPDGQPQAVLGILRDITEYKLAARASRESEAKYRALVDQSLQGIVVTHGPPLRVIYANSAFEEITGYTLQELIALEDNLDRLIYPADRTLVLERAQQRLRDEVVPPSYEYRIVHKNGDIRWVLNYASRIEYDGEPAIQSAIADITERKQAELALHESEEKYSNLFQYFHDAIFLHDLEGNIIDVNQQFIDQFGYSREELLTMKIADMHPPDAIEASHEVVDRIVREGSIHYEIAFKRKNGEVFPAEVSSSLFNIGGQKVIQGIARDITERRRAEEQLKEREQRYRALFENTNDAVFILSLDMVHLEVNQRAADLLGYTIEELLGVPVRDVVAPGEYPDSQRVIRALLAGEQVPVYERLFRRKDGTIFPVEINAALVTDAEGNPLHFQSVVRDITERKRAEQALLESEHRFRGVAENMDDALIIREAGKVVYVNERACEIFGYPREELMTMSTKDLCAPDERERFQAFIEQLQHRGGGFDELELHVIHKDGSSRFIHYRFWVRREYKTVIHFVIANDITQRKLAEQALQESETKYRSLVDKSIQGIILLQGTPPRIAFANPEGAKILGYSPEELVSFSAKDFVNLLYPEDRDIILQRTQEILEGSLETTHISYGPREVRMFHRDKSLHWIELFARRVEYEGAPAVQALAIDVTERKEAELALKASEEKFRALVEELDDWVFEMDAAGTLTYSNISVENILGYSVGQMIGLNPFDFLHPDDKDTTLQLFKELVEHKQPIRNLTARYLHRDGSLVILEAVAHPLLDDEGNLIGYRGIYRDLTERLQMLDQLRQYTTEEP
jgi:PAS domain S-box-containing protein